MNTLKKSSPVSLALECDVVEIRLDLLHKDVLEQGHRIWKHLLPFPLLFTARCKAEGSPFNLDNPTRIRMLRSALNDAIIFDIEVSSIPLFGDFLQEIRDKKIPWLGSFHDFEKLPSAEILQANYMAAIGAGAQLFKVAANLTSIQSLSDLAQFQNKNRTTPVSSMGMGALAPVSRLLCAQAGSILNYGYIGNSPTAPGQWSARKLKEAIQSLLPFES